MTCRSKVFVAVGGCFVALATLVPNSVSATAVKPRIIDIEMGPIAYAPKTIRVKAGEPVRLRFHNGSNVGHEAVIGDAKTQNNHEKMMKAMKVTGDAHDMAGPDYAFAAPGKTVTLDYTFKTSGRTTIGCHQPGHFASGMRIAVSIDPKTSLG